jgi:alanine racemase
LDARNEACSIRTLPYVSMLSAIHLDAEALRHNYRAFCSLAGQERVAPVLKSNAYGHGLTEVYRGLSGEAPPWLCVNYVAEAGLLRTLGYQGRLLVVGPTPARQLSECAVVRAEPVIGNRDVLAAWIEVHDRPRAHIKFDTGMGRQGFAPDDAPAIAARLAPHRADVAGVCTHFANVEDVTEQEYAKEQLRRLHAAAAAFASSGHSLLVHAAASASTLIMPDSRLDLARVGISLYGVWPSQPTRISYLQITGSMFDLRPVLTWRTEVTTVKEVAAGQYIGYGCTYRTNHPMTVAVLPVGYFEGYPRLAGTHGAYVLVRGVRCPIVGRICMNMMMADVTHAGGVSIGEQATLIGRDGDDAVHAHDVAGWAQTIHYELLSRLHPDIPRTLATASDEPREERAFTGAADDPRELVHG